MPESKIYAVEVAANCSLTTDDSPLHVLMIFKGFLIGLTDMKAGINRE
jgi:hypothetical protein